MFYNWDTFGKICLIITQGLTNITLMTPNIKIIWYLLQFVVCFLDLWCVGIQICNVRPNPDLRAMFNGMAVPEKVLNFYKVNDVDCFQFDRPFHRPQKDENNEFKVCVKICLIVYTLDDVRNCSRN